MRALFIGDHHNPGGPNEVNRNLLSNLRFKDIWRLKTSNLLIKKIGGVLLIPFANVVIMSGIMFQDYELKLAKKLRKKILYIMHGSNEIETGIQSKKEIEILASADKILCVSKTYSEFIKNIYPSLKYKIGVLTNGVNWDEYDRILKRYPREDVNKNRIVLFGGGRPIKRNLEVCRAIYELNKELGLNLHVDIYGTYRDSDLSPKIADIPCVTYHELIPHEKVNIELTKSFLFIQNSDFESFSLALMDALGLGVNILLSKYVGAKDIIPALSNDDIIENPKSVEELKIKILNILKHPNNTRLYSSVDRKATSLEAAAQNLIKECNNILK